MICVWCLTGIAVHRIKEYDGEYVVFGYTDKTDGQEKTEKVTVEEFISRIIRHIPDEHFKTIRYYGVYSRRKKKPCREKMAAWQETAKKWIVKIARVLKRRNWRERMKATSGKDPLVCPKCECYYEYKGEVCREDGRLQVKVARCEQSRACLERMISHFTGVQKTKSDEEKEAAAAKPKQVSAEQRDGQLCLFDMRANRSHSA